MNKRLVGTVGLVVRSLKDNHRPCLPEIVYSKTIEVHAGRQITRYYCDAMKSGFFVLINASESVVFGVGSWNRVDDRGKNYQQ